MADTVHPLVVSAFGADRPGIAAAVTSALAAAGCNLSDTSMAILGGQFAMMMTVESPLDADALADALESTAHDGDLTVAVRPAALAPDHHDDAGRPYALSVHGADHPGIVAGVTSVLAERAVNIVDMDTRLVGSGDNATYAMFLDVVVPDDVDAEALATALAARCEELGVAHTLRPDDADIL